VDIGYCSWYPWNVNIWQISENQIAIGCVQPDNNITFSTFDISTPQSPILVRNQSFDYNIWGGNPQTGSSPSVQNGILYMVTSTQINSEIYNFHIVAFDFNTYKFEMIRKNITEDMINGGLTISLSYENTADFGLSSSGEGFMLAVSSNNDPNYLVFLGFDGQVRNYYEVAGMFVGSNLANKMSWCMNFVNDYHGFVINSYGPSEELQPNGNVSLPIPAYSTTAYDDQYIFYSGFVNYSPNVTLFQIPYNDNYIIDANAISSVTLNLREVAITYANNGYIYGYTINILNSVYRFSYTV